MNTTLVVMAAGMGSRFGGLKQIEPITPSGKVILDFSVYDALKAGFDKVVFVIRKDMERDFVDIIGNRISQSVPVDYVIQDMSILPRGRLKPFGTGHAILCCKNAVKEPFTVINADDYYGLHAFENIRKHLLGAQNGEYAMVSYLLGQTLSVNGVVTRGICDIKDGFLKNIKECKKINALGQNEEDGTAYALDTPVSMNLWGLTCDVFGILENEFAEFLNTADLMKDEFLLPNVIFSVISKRLAAVRDFPNTDKWYGITYREDLSDVKKALNAMIAKGFYSGF